jgi:hypothetical protein
MPREAHRAGAGPKRMPSSGAGRFRRQFRKAVRDVELRGILLADPYVVKLPNRSSTPCVGRLKPANATYWDPVWAQPKRAGLGGNSGLDGGTLPGPGKAGLTELTTARAARSSSRLSIPRCANSSCGLTHAGENPTFRIALHLLRPVGRIVGITMGYKASAGSPARCGAKDQDG